MLESSLARRSMISPVRSLLPSFTGMISHFSATSGRILWAWRIMFSTLASSLYSGKKTEREGTFGIGAPSGISAGKCYHRPSGCVEQKKKLGFLEKGDIHLRVNQPGHLVTHVHREI